MKTTKTKKKPPTKVTDDGGLLLTYLSSSQPPLVQVNASARIDIAAVTGSAAGNIYCSEVVLYVPVGTDATNLYLASPAPTSSVNRSDWAVSSMVIKSGGDIGLDADTSYATFTFDNRNQTSTLINYNLVFGIDGMVNQTTGDFAISVMETSGTDPNNLTQRTGVFTLTKYSPQFYLQNFLATVSTAPLQPVTEFQNGAAITLSWESNGTFFQVYKKNTATPVYAGTNTTFTLSSGVATDTTFFLVAMMTADPGSVQPPAGFEPIYLYDALTITVTNPDLTPKTVNVSGTLGVTGNTNLSNAAIGGTLGVSGNTTLSSASVSSTLGVSGNTTLAAASASSLSVTGATSLAGATTGDLITGNINGNQINANNVSSSNNLVAGNYVTAAGISTNNRTFMTTGIPGNQCLYLAGGGGAGNNVVASEFHTGNTNAIYAQNNSGNYPTIWSQNTGRAPPPDPAGKQVFGIGTNGRISSESGNAVITHLPTSKGHRVVTSPLSLEIEIQFSGEAKLSKGKAQIQFDKEVSEIISHSKSYRVLLTPVGKCQGLYVTKKSRKGFTVKEIGDKNGKAAFDWFVIARKPQSLKINEPEDLPGALPKMAALGEEPPTKI